MGKTQSLIIVCNNWTARDEDGRKSAKDDKNLVETDDFGHSAEVQFMSN